MKPLPHWIFTLWNS